MPEPTVVHPAGKTHVIPRDIIYPFILVTSLFALWGFANDITNPMVAAFKQIMLISHFQSSLVQFAFYGGYCVMAIPAAIFIKRFTYKSGILVGLGLYSAGALLFIPSSMIMAFWAFLISYFILTCGLSFLETSSNPYILAMGPEENATRRLNFAQAFNPMGSLTGMFVAQQLILARLDDTTEAQRQVLAETAPEQFKALQVHDLNVLRGPYVAIGLVVLVFFFIFLISKLPRSKGEEDNRLNLGPTLSRLWRNKKYIEGVIAQTFYVGVQIMCWTFIIQYAMNELGMSKETAQGYNIIAMVIFCSSRFICTYLLKYFSPGRLLMSLAVGGFALLLGTIFIKGMVGLYCLIAVSACMSLMFPTIYGIALKGLGDDAKIGAAGLIMAIGGGSVMPPLQAAIMDMSAFNLGLFTLSSTRVSFVLPLICFVVIAVFGFRTSRIHGHSY
ncbi:L-fucose:H+ symporter permease [candidate division KSB1 bacterium]|nr:L-fucose:H+ symporter permease [candidate division KSB1 bacterium]